MFGSIMVFGSGNKFRIRRSQSKASYLNYRREPREKEKGLPNFQGSYKRTMSPSGGRILDGGLEKCKDGDCDTLNSESSDFINQLKEEEDDSGEEEEEGHDNEEINNIDNSRHHTPSQDNNVDDCTKKIDNNNCDKEITSKTLPRNYALKMVSTTNGGGSGVSGQTLLPKRLTRSPRAQSDPTSSAKTDKKTVSSSTQLSLDEMVTNENGQETVAKSSSTTTILIGRSQSDRTYELRNNNNKDENNRLGDRSSASTSSSSSKDMTKVSDASSQTTPAPSPPPQPILSRRQLQEEIECEKLSRDLASHLSPSHKLHGILVPGPEVKRTTDYVTGLFRMDFTPRSRNSIAAAATTTTTTDVASVAAAAAAAAAATTTPTQTSETINGGGSEIKSSSSTPATLSPTNPYFTTSECKARLMSSLASHVQSDMSSSTSMNSLQQKKEELMMRLSRKLSVLRAESIAVTEETAVNEALGQTVTERVERVARPQELAKFRLHIKEVGHITSLLLSLSGRLARAENALLNLSTAHHDRKVLEEKRDKLLGQLNEAKQLKSNIDQRSANVSSILYNYLTQEEYTDYDHFINMKSKLLVDSREIAEKIQLGEEQLAALKETLDQVR